MQSSNTKSVSTPGVLFFISWLIALSAMLGSLFFSQIMQFPPCVLCWYQRICMYPLVILFLVAAIKEDTNVVSYSFPLVVIGWLIALYHNLLHYEIVPESASPCLEGSSCATVFINWLGFITIPMLSFIAFSILLGLLFFLKKENKRIKNEE